MDATNFLKWRKTLAYTQVEAAAKLGFTRATIQNWERRITRVPRFVELACLELTRQWKQRPEFGAVTLVYSEEPIWPNPDDSTHEIFVQCQLCSNNEVAIRQALRLSKNQNFSNPLIIEPDGGVVWSTPELMHECERRKQEARVKQLKSRRPKTKTRRQLG
jgi:DNA-binding XRE family transcriptional regulator